MWRIASSRFLLSTTEGVITTRSNRMKFRLYWWVTALMRDFCTKMYGHFGDRNIEVAIRWRVPLLTDEVF